MATARARTLKECALDQVHRLAGRCRKLEGSSSEASPCTGTFIRFGSIRHYLARSTDAECACPALWQSQLLLRAGAVTATGSGAVAGNTTKAAALEPSSSGLGGLLLQLHTLLDLNKSRLAGAPESALECLSSGLRSEFALVAQSPATLSPNSLAVGCCPGPISSASLNRGELHIHG